MGWSNGTGISADEERGDGKGGHFEPEPPLADDVPEDSNTWMGTLWWYLGKLKPEEGSRLSVLLWCLKQILFLGGSFDFSMAFIFLNILIGHYQAAKNEANPLEVAPLALTILESAIVTFMAVYFSLSQELSPKWSMIETAEREEDKAILYKELGYIYKAAALLSVPLILPVIGIMTFSERIFLALGQEPLVAAAAQRFLRIMSPAAWLIIARLFSEQWPLTKGKNKEVMGFALASLVVGTGLGALLTFGPPKLGLDGIAYGYVAQTGLVLAFFVGYLKLRQPFSKIPFATEWDFKEIGKKMWNILKTGYQFSLQYAGELTAGFMMTVMAGWLNPTALASQNFAQAGIFTWKILSIAAGLQAMHKFGRDKKDEKISIPLAVQYARSSVIASLILVLPFSILLAARPNWFIDTFSNSATSEIRTMASQLLQIISAGMLTGAPNVVFMYVIKQLGILTPQHVITICANWLGVALGYYLAFEETFASKGLGMGVIGLGIGWAVGQTLASLGNSILFFKNVNVSSIHEVQNRATPAPTISESSIQAAPSFAKNRWNLFNCCPSVETELEEQSLMTAHPSFNNYGTLN